MTRALRARRAAGFTLLEIIVALGVFAVGASAAFALLVAAAAAGRRAEHDVQAALIAETVIDDIRLDLARQLDLEDYPRASEPDPQTGSPAIDGANPETRLLVRDGTWSAYPDYRYDVALTPLASPDPQRPWRYLVEVEVRWAEKGQGRTATYATIVAPTAIAIQNPGPSRR